MSTCQRIKGTQREEGGGKGVAPEKSKQVPRAAPRGFPCSISVLTLSDNYVFLSQGDVGES